MFHGNLGAGVDIGGGDRGRSISSCFSWQNVGKRVYLCLRKMRLHERVTVFRSSMK